MAKVIWTTSAVDDLGQIGKFIERDSVHYAKAVVSRLYNAAGRLGRFPLSGRRVPELNDPALREVIADGYRIIYRVAKSTVYTLTIVHGRQDLVS